MDYVRKGWYNTFNSIKKHKLLFALIVILQIIFVASSLALGTQYLIKILEDTQGIIGPLEKANYDSQKIEQGEPFTPDYASIYNSYRSMLKKVLSFCAGIAALFLLLNGSIWLLSHWMLQEKKQWKIKIKEGVNFLLKIWVSTFLLLGTFAIASYYILLHFIRVSQSFSNIAIVLKSLLIALFVVYYFFLAALAIAPPSTWKKFAVKWTQIAIIRFRKTAILFFTIIVTLFVSFTALYGAIEYEISVIFLLLLGIICMIILCITRLVWIAGVQEIEHETNHN